MAFPNYRTARTPVIAAVNGMAVGGGFEIAMAADLIVAADHAQFWLPEPALGILPDAGAVKLPRLLPPHVAREMLLTGRRMDAAEAAAMGSGRPGGAGRRVARRRPRVWPTPIATSAPLSVAALLDIERRTITLSTDEAMANAEVVGQLSTAIDSEDAIEGSSRVHRTPPTGVARPLTAILRPKPNSCWATLRIWISSEPSVMR